MSKFDKFVNNPKLFFKDAFKKKEEKISASIYAVNGHFKKLRIPIHLDIQELEKSFVDSATSLSHDNKISRQIIKIIDPNQKPSKQTESSSSINFMIGKSQFERLYKRFDLIKYKNHDLKIRLNKLTPDAQAIYLELKRKTRVSGEK